MFTRNFDKKNPWPWPKLDINDVALKLYDNNCLVLPGLGEYSIAGESGYNWSLVCQHSNNSVRLWGNSLMNIQVLAWHGIENNNTFHISRSIKLFMDYFAYLHSFEGKQPAYAWNDEHAVANRLQVVLAFASYSVVYNSFKISHPMLLRHIERHAQWLADDENYVYNNHGTMMDIALLQASFMINDVYPKYSESLAEHSLHRLSIMLKKTFDEDGCCTENSPSYHFVNLALFKNISSMLDRLNVKTSYAFKERLDNVCTRAQAVGRILLKHDQKVPLIGDSLPDLGVFFDASYGDEASICHQSANSFPASGLFIFKNQSVHMTLRGGGSSFSHRHIDDTSITLSVNSYDIIVDPGLYSYDGSDKKRRWYCSHYAHSGCFLDDSSEIRWADHISPQAFARLERHCIDEDLSAKVRVVSRLSKTGSVTRQLTIQEDGKIICIDDLIETHADTGFSLQFILHPDCTTHEVPGKPDTVEIVNGPVTVHLTVFECNIKVETSCYSDSFLKERETNMLRVRGPATLRTLKSLIQILNYAS